MARITVSILGRDVEKFCNLDGNGSDEALADTEDPYRTHVAQARVIMHTQVYTRINYVCIWSCACIVCGLLLLLQKPHEAVAGELAQRNTIIIVRLTTSLCVHAGRLTHASVYRLPCLRAFA